MSLATIITKKNYLIFAWVSVVIIALLYGISPHWFAETFLGITDLNVNFAHILRAVMCLYLALSLFWIYAAFNEEYQNIALVNVFLFCAGLAIGRVISIVVDGQPAGLLVFYVIIEAALVPVTYMLHKD